MITLKALCVNFTTGSKVFKLARDKSSYPYEYIKSWESYEKMKLSSKNGF